MSRYAVTDLSLSEDGDLILENGDLGLVAGSAMIAQGTRNRIRSVHKDWFYDKIGATLEQLLGRPNTKETGDEGVNLLTKALTVDGFIDNADLYIKSTPISGTRIVYFVFINSPFNVNGPIGFEVALDLGNGIKIKEV